MVWIILGIVVVIGLWFMTTYNSLVSMRNKVEEAFSSMDVILKKRFDLIPNLVETVKGYAKHESETLERVIQARNMAVNATNDEDRMAGEAALTASLRQVFALSESYPDLKANENFNKFQDSLQKIEDEISGARRYYNAIVNRFNVKTETFPSAIIASMFGFKRKPLYEVNEPGERDNVKVQF